MAIEEKATLIAQEATRLLDKPLNDPSRPVSSHEAVAFALKNQPDVWKLSTYMAQLGSQLPFNEQRERRMMPGRAIDQRRLLPRRVREARTTPPSPQRRYSRLERAQEKLEMRTGIQGLLMAHACLYLHNSATLRPGAQLTLEDFMKRIAPDLAQANLPKMRDDQIRKEADIRGFTSMDFISRQSQVLKMVQQTTESLKPLFNPLYWESDDEKDLEKISFRNTDVGFALATYVRDSRLQRLAPYERLCEQGMLFEDTLLLVRQAREMPALGVELIGRQATLRLLKASYNMNPGQFH